MDILIDWLNWLLGPETRTAPTQQATSGILSTPPEPAPSGTHLWPRWLFLRSLGLIYFSAFYSLIFQIRGLIGPNGILPADDYLQAIAHSLRHARFWYAPTLLWFSSGSNMLLALCWVGMAGSLLLTFNFWPRMTLVICFV